MSLARRSSRFSRSSSAMRWASAVEVPARPPESISACLNQFRNDSVPTPSWRATRVTTPRSGHPVRRWRHGPCAPPAHAGLAGTSSGRVIRTHAPSSLPRYGASADPRPIHRPCCWGARHRQNQPHPGPAATSPECRAVRATRTSGTMQLKQLRRGAQWHSSGRLAPNPPPTVVASADPVRLLPRGLPQPSVPA